MSCYSNQFRVTIYVRYRHEQRRTCTEIRLYPTILFRLWKFDTSSGDVTTLGEKHRATQRERGLKLRSPPFLMQKPLAGPKILQSKKTGRWDKLVPVTLIYLDFAELLYIKKTFQKKRRCRTACITAFFFKVFLTLFRLLIICEYSAF